MKPLRDITIVDWNSATSVERSAGGMSGGVYFVKLDGDQAIIIKPDLDIAADVMGTTLAQFLGVRCPNMRLIKTSEPEGALVVDRLSVLDEAKPDNLQQGSIVCLVL